MRRAHACVHVCVSDSSALRPALAHQPECAHRVAHARACAWERTHLGETASPCLTVHGGSPGAIGPTALRAAAHGAREARRELHARTHALHAPLEAVLDSFEKRTLVLPDGVLLDVVLRGLGRREPRLVSLCARVHMRGTRAFVSASAAARPHLKRAYSGHPHIRNTDSDCCINTTDRRSFRQYE